MFRKSKSLFKVCDERVGFYTSDANFRGVSDYVPCALTFIETGQYECLTMAVAKQSPYITSLNFKLVLLNLIRNYIVVIPQIPWN